MNDDCKLHSGLCKSIQSEREKSEIRFQMIENNIEVAKREMDRRLEGMNEFRKQLDKQSSTFMARSEIEILISKNSDKIRDIENSMAKLGSSSTWADRIILILINAGMVLAVWIITKG